MIRLLLFLGAAFTLWAEPEVLPMRFSNLPSCAGSTDSRLLLRLREPSGTGVEIWCAKEAPGFNYEYRLLTADGRTKRLDRCQLTDGINSASVDHTGPIAETPLENGGQLLRTPGRLIRFIHNNWDAQNGHHAIYDFARQQTSFYQTIAAQDGIGRAIHVLTSATTSPQIEVPGALGKLPPERKFDPNRITCITALSEEGMGIHQEEVAGFVEPGKAGKYTIAWPESAAIDKVEFDVARRQLKLRFPPTARKTIISIAFPRTMLGLGKELAHVRLDGRFIDSDETTTSTHKVIRFRLEEPAREATMLESGGFPFFMVSGVALVGAILIGGVIGMLFRRKLPAVPDEIDPRDRDAVD